MLIHKATTDKIIGAAIEVHKALGPGLLESAYEACLCHELHLRGLNFKRQVELPLKYKNVTLDCCYRMDIVVFDEVVVEIKSTEKTLAIHEAQLMSYLRMSGYRCGLLINFNVALLKDGLIRRVL
jgi:GxxExxY protein